MESDGVLTHH